VTQPAAAAPVTLLVVDDHTLFRRGLIALLGQDAGLHVVGEAGDAAEALRLLCLQQPDVILLDWLMPGELSGLDVLQRLKAVPEWRHIPVAMVTSQGDGPHILEGFRHGADEFFVKPFKPLRLAQWVRQVAGRPHETP